MNPTERGDRIDQRVDDRGLICFADLMRELEMSRAMLVSARTAQANPIRGPAKPA